MKRLFLLIVLPSLLLGAGCFKSSPSVKSNADIRASASSVQALPFQSVDEYIPSDQKPEVAEESLPQAPQEEVVKVGEHASLSKNLIVSSLIEKQALENPFVILGRARTFENVVNWRIRDARGKVVAQGSVMTNAKEKGSYGSFRVRAFISEIPDTVSGKVDIYTLSPKDGSEQDVVSIQVLFSKERGVVKVFFANVLKDPNVEHCDVVYPVARRVVKTQNTAEIALLELLKGPTAQEQTSGSRTTIVPGIVLRSVKIEGGVATADFSNELVYGLGGSCRVQALIAQIDQTLKQFDGVSSVKILVDGNDATTLLQP